MANNESNLDYNASFSKADSGVEVRVQAEKNSSPFLHPLLAASGLTKSFGGIKAVDNAEIEVVKGSITGLIGPNGAGKTTLFNLLSNFIRTDRGRVIFDGEPIQQLQSYQIAQQGMVRTFQVARTLSRLSVMENMLLAAQKQTGENFLASLVPISAGKS